MKNIGILILALLVCLSCSNDDNEDIKKSNEKAMISFVFAAVDNEALSTDVKATIDEEKKTVTGQFPSGTNITSLKPSITISEDAKVSPGDKEAEDFSEAVTYTVTAGDGSKTEYTVIATVKKSDAKQITAFTFLATQNESLSEDVTATIDEDTNIIVAEELPSNVDLTALIPSILVSDGAMVSPNDNTAIDFTNTVVFTVTAEDGSTSEYDATITRALTEREALIDLYNANPDNALGWDLDNEDISNWRGVRLNDLGQVILLAFYDQGIITVPGSIKYLIHLRSLEISERISSVPDEIVELKQLENLKLSSGVFEEIPSAVLELTQLKTLGILYSKLKSVDPKIGNLTNLTELILRNNELTEIPRELGKLTRLERLFLFGNQITIVPKEICDLNIEDFQMDDTTACEQ
ncbi:MAG: DUF5018 domain-containing protein [Bacteroidota bacterium]